jgi:hypothetical protein
MPEKVAQFIQDAMAPVVKVYSSESSTTKADAALRGLYLSLCRDAFHFSLLLRRCKDLYKCESPMPGTKLVYMDADAQDREPSMNGTITSNEPSNPEDADIAFLLFGTLVKYPELDPGARLVLEKAHVVIYQK